MAVLTGRAANTSSDGCGEGNWLEGAEGASLLTQILRARSRFSPPASNEHAASDGNMLRTMAGLAIAIIVAMSRGKRVRLGRAVALWLSWRMLDRWLTLRRERTLLHEALKSEAKALLRHIETSPRVSTTRVQSTSAGTQTEAALAPPAVLAPPPLAAGSLAPPPLPPLGAVPPPPPPPPPLAARASRPALGGMPSAAQLALGLSGLRRADVNDGDGDGDGRKDAANLPGAKLAGGMTVSLEMLQAVKLREKKAGSTPQKPKEETPEALRQMRRLKARSREEEDDADEENADRQTAGSGQEVGRVHSHSRAQPPPPHSPPPQPPPPPPPQQQNKGGRQPLGTAGAGNVPVAAKGRAADDSRRSHRLGLSPLSPLGRTPPAGVNSHAGRVLATAAHGAVAGHLHPAGQRASTDAPTRSRPATRSTRPAWPAPLPAPPEVLAPLRAARRADMSSSPPHHDVGKGSTSQSGGKTALELDIEPSDEGSDGALQLWRDFCDV